MASSIPGFRLPAQLLEWVGGHIGFDLLKVIMAVPVFLVREAERKLAVCMLATIGRIATDLGCCWHGAAVLGHGRVHRALRRLAFDGWCEYHLSDGGCL